MSLESRGRWSEARIRPVWLGTAAVAALAIGAGFLAFFGGLRIGDGSDSADVAPLDRVYMFDAGGLLPLTGGTELPVQPGSVSAHWYTFGGWDVVVFEGLDLETAGPLCLGVSVLNSATHQVDYLSASPTEPGACDSAGGGPVVLAQADRGVRTCATDVSYITGIPAETTGVLHASLTAYLGDGTGVGIAGRLQTTAGPGRELDAATLGCGPLPIARTVPDATPTAATVPETPAPGGAGAVAASDREPPPHPERPSRCPVAAVGRLAAGLEEITDSEAAPYFIHRPLSGDQGAATVIFLAGGSGGRSSAERVWDIVFAGRPEARDLQVVLPYSPDGALIDEAGRTLSIVNEVLACIGGDPARVHLAGTSNGGLAAFALMTAHPESFASLLGAPGAFPVQDPASIDPATLGRVLAGRSVFNGVGSLDAAWRPEVIGTHNALVRAGIESVFVEFPLEGHVLNVTLRPEPMFEFWSSH